MKPLTEEEIHEAELAACEEPIVDKVVEEPADYVPESNSGWQKKIPIEERLRISHLPFKLPIKLMEILDGLKWAIHFKKQSAVIIIDGRSGMGKTTLSFQCGKYMTPDFNLDNVYFNPETFLQGLAVAQKGQTLIFDEAMLLSSRAALSAINRMIVIAMSMIRSKNLLIIFNVNSIFDLDRNLALSRADLLLHCYGESLTDKGKFLAFFKGGDGQDRIKQLYILGKKYYSYAHPKSNFNNNFGPYFVVDEAEYEKRKQVGVDKFLTSGKLDKESKDKIARDRLIITMYYKDKRRQDEIMEITGLSRETISNVVSNYRKNMILEGKWEGKKLKELKIEEGIQNE
jgi:hypothetical protein